MRISSFRARNFKGIKDCSLELQTLSAGETIVTLIGLNESGKTTVLEAISSFIGQDQDLSTLIGAHRGLPEQREWVPKHEKANFTGDIEFIATVNLDFADKDAIVDAVRKKHGLQTKLSSIPLTFDITKRHVFENSVPKSWRSWWEFGPQFREAGTTRYREADSEGPLKEAWVTAAQVLTDRLPRICYFPSVLFDLPEKIYVEGDEGPNKYFRELLSDILASSGKGLRLKEHILDRVENYRAGKFQKDTKDQLDAVFSKMSAELNKVVFGAWNDIFKQRPRNKKIILEWHLDAAKDNKLYCQFYIQDGDEKYSISERSLGFRWFFYFLLFTQFTGAAAQSSRRTYFLFDEPASNLHGLAQLQLLASFPKVSGAGNLIVYSTHSHYMIEPLWLDRAYIVLNSAIDYDSDELKDEFAPKHTQITLDKYRNFVGQHPNQVSYYQPVLDRLDYVVSPLIGSKCCLIVEGKQDYAALRYFLPQLGCTNIDILPGSGAGTADVLISLFIGWGRRFLLLLDDDDDGRAAKARYIEDYLISKEHVRTLGDISDAFKNKKLEGLFSPSMAELVKGHLQLSHKPRKKDFALFFMERLSKNKPDGLLGIDQKTIHAMQTVASFIGANLKA